MHRINLGNVRVLEILPDFHLEGNAYIHIALQVFSFPTPSLRSRTVYVSRGLSHEYG